ncbi:MAG: BrnA antitoxin family protein [Bryobacteraceae bacterium]
MISIRDMNRNETEIYVRYEEKKNSRFKSEDDERKFWAASDSTEYVDWPSGERAKLIRVKPSLKTISLRLPVSMIEDLKVLANRRDVPYQSLLKVFLAERLARERLGGSERTHRAK